MRYPFFFNKNSVKDSFNYQYASMDGKELLYSYFRNRSNVLKKIEKNILRDNKLFISEYYDYKLQNYLKQNILVKNTLKKKVFYKPKFNAFKSNSNKKKIVETQNYLKKLIVNILEKKNYFDKKKIISFLKSYEVKKKIYSYYSHNLKIGYGEKTLFENYILFYFILIISYVKKKDIRYLNTMLKVSDFIISKKNEKNLTKLYSENLYFSIKLEVQLLRKIISIKKIIF